MDELVAEAMVFLPLTLGPVLALLCAPWGAVWVRTALAVVLGAGAVGLLGVAWANAGTPRSLPVVNPFFDPDRGAPVPYTVGVASAPGWAWPSVAAAALAVAALGLLALRRAPRGAPRPVWYAFLVTMLAFAARLGLEATAAPRGLTWAMGVTLPTALVLPFFGAWVGARGGSWWRLLLALLTLALLQRAVVVAAAYFAITRHLGTHLDVGAIREVNLPAGHRDFTGPGNQSVQQWLSLMVVPQMVLWVLLTVVGGLLLGAVPLRLARRKVR